MALSLCPVCKVNRVPSKKATYCGARCRQRARRARQRGGLVVELRPKQVPERATTAAADGLPSVMAETRKRLEAAERADTPKGAAAMALAARIDDCELVSALAGLVKQWELTLAGALDGAVVDPDVVDDLRDRREARERQLLG